MGAESGEGGDAVRNSLLAIGGCGCVGLPLLLVGGSVITIIFGGLGVLLAPLIALILLFTGGGGGGGSDNYSESDAEQVQAVFEGDGKGELAEDTVPADLYEDIKDAGAICPEIGPIVIASQLEKESNFDATKVGKDGKLGLSQLTPDVFNKYGKDDDDNGKTSALDAKDSIMAQGRYLCDLAGQARTALLNGEVNATNTDQSTDSAVLDIALAAYDVGMDTVRAAKGVPQNAEAQGYVLAIRAQFSKYSGMYTPPPGTTPGTTPSPTDPADADSPSPTSNPSPTA